MAKKAENAKLKIKSKADKGSKGKSSTSRGRPKSDLSLNPKSEKSTSELFKEWFKKKDGRKFAEWLLENRNKIKKQQLSKLCYYLDRERSDKCLIEEFCAAQGLKRLTKISVLNVWYFS